MRTQAQWGLSQRYAHDECFCMSVAIQNMCAYKGHLGVLGVLSGETSSML